VKTSWGREDSDSFKNVRWSIEEGFPEGAFSGDGTSIGGTSRTSGTAQAWQQWTSLATTLEPQGTYSANTLMELGAQELANDGGTSVRLGGTWPLNIFDDWKEKGTSQTTQAWQQSTSTMARNLERQDFHSTVSYKGTSDDGGSGSAQSWQQWTSTMATNLEPQDTYSAHALKQLGGRESTNEMGSTRNISGTMGTWPLNIFDVR
jgi:hypothetical protein